MVSVQELKNVEPAQWQDAADDAVRAAKQCAALAGYARDEIADTLKMCWVGDGGRAARDKFVKHAGEYESAEIALKELARVYDALALDIIDAQRDLTGALTYANSQGLKVDESGRVGYAKPIMVPEGDTEHLKPLHHAADIIGDALTKATKADLAAASQLRVVEGMVALKDPKLARQALDPGSPLAIALRLSGGRDGLHPVNVPQTVLDAVDRASAETGISKKLLLATLWQEQQWYQNQNPSLRGPLTEFGRFFDWGLTLGPVPDKSLGITHMKMETARKVIEANPRKFLTADGKDLGTLSDTELTAVIEGNPDLDVRLSAFHYKTLQEQSAYGTRSDAQLFTLYAADTPDVREKNEQYGDESEHRGGAIKARLRNWEELSPHLDDAAAWEGLTDEQRSTALRQLESQTPAGHHVSLDPIYGGGVTTGTGSGDPEPGTPSPEPGPAPTPPGNG
ncbi:hypothetical protein [Streptomyces sp. NPDC056512]|uniref:hypothetical protein n=1 Tax=Streptomyces sp. NPDC056512 TaxID=3345846 RepID=UPI00368D3810